MHRPPYAIIPFRRVIPIIHTMSIVSLFFFMLVLQSILSFQWLASTLIMHHGPWPIQGKWTHIHVNTIQYNTPIFIFLFFLVYSTCGWSLATVKWSRAHAIAILTCTVYATTTKQTWETLALTSLWGEPLGTISQNASVSKSTPVRATSHMSQEPWPWNCKSPKESVQGRPKTPSGSSLAKIVEQRAIKNRVQYIYCR